MVLCPAEFSERYNVTEKVSAMATTNDPNYRFNAKNFCYETDFITVARYATPITVTQNRLFYVMTQMHTKINFVSGHFEFKYQKSCNYAGILNPITLSG